MTRLDILECGMDLCRLYILRSHEIDEVISLGSRYRALVSRAVDARRIESDLAVEQGRESPYTESIR